MANVNFDGGGGGSTDEEETQERTESQQTTEQSTSDESQDIESGYRRVVNRTPEPGDDAGDVSQDTTSEDTSAQEATDDQQGRELVEDRGNRREMQRQSIKNELSEKAGEDVDASDIKLQEENGRVVGAKAYEGPQTEGGAEIITRNQTEQQEDVEAEPPETLDESQAIDDNNRGATQSTRTDVNVGESIDNNANLGEDVEDLGDTEVMINDRRLESVFNEGAQRWDDASQFVGEKAGEGVGVLESRTLNVDVPGTDQSVYDVAGVETNDEGEGPIESGTEAVVAGVGRSANPYAIGSAAKEVGETGVFVGEGIASGDYDEALERTNEAVSQAGVASGLAARSAGNNPVETGGALVGGALTGTAATSAARRASSVDVGGRVRSSIEGNIREGRTLGRDTRAQSDLSQVRRSSSSQETKTKTITRDDPEAEATDLTPEEWSKQLFESDVESPEQTTRVPQQREIEADAEQTQTRSQSPEDQLPPKEEFPSEEAYQRELERARQRQQQQDADLEETTAAQEADMQATQSLETEASASGMRPSGTTTVGALAGLRDDEMQLDTAMAATDVEEEITTGQVALAEETADLGVSPAEATDEFLDMPEATRTRTQTATETDLDVGALQETTTDLDTTATETDTATVTERITATESQSRPRKDLPFPDPNGGDGGAGGRGGGLFDKRFSNPVADPETAGEEVGVVGFGGDGLEDIENLDDLEDI